MRSSRPSAPRDRRPRSSAGFAGAIPSGPRPRRSTAGLLCALLLLALPAFAAEWGTIVPGATTTDEVQTRYGAPTKSEKLKVEGYDTEQWTYDGARAPAGLRRMIVDFGLLKPDGYKPAVVRTLRLEPKAGVFPRRWVLLGWGLPDAETTIEGVPTFFYHSGLIVYFDKELTNAATMMFTVPQAPPGKAGR